MKLFCQVARSLILSLVLQYGRKCSTYARQILSAEVFNPFEDLSESLSLIIVLVANINYPHRVAASSRF